MTDDCGQVALGGQVEPLVQGADALGAWLGVGFVWLLRRPALAALR